MKKEKIRAKDLVQLGFTDNSIVSMVLEILLRHYKHSDILMQKREAKALLLDPEMFVEDEIWGKIAHKMIEISSKIEPKEQQIELRTEKAPYKIFGKEQIESGAIQQMEVAVSLPVSVAGVLMPDGHPGYGLPIGGVLATENAIIPYAVGVDIGCRMALTLYDLKPEYLERYRKNMQKWLFDETKFGMGSEHKHPMDDAIFSRPEFNDIKLVASLKDKAYRQIGTSGSGNHFVEFGIVEVLDPNNEWGIATGKYVGLLSHSGSRGLGATIAGHFTQIAMKTTKLPNIAKHLAWLDMNTQEGMEYWLSMNLAGDYASACHHHIHKRLAKAVGEKPIALVENHHNFAWKEKMPDGKEVIVHRKGATPAGKGVLGIIPGSMATSGFIVRGKGEAGSLHSASHGAGRLMSRKQATETFTKKEFQQILEKNGVELIGGGMDESPMAYKDIHKVMEYQKSLVEIIGTFHPKIVRMDS